jgi:hypothetical protein
VNRKKLIIGVAIGIALICITLTVVGIQRWRKSHQPKAQQKILVSNLAYCNSNNDKPCIESFSVDADGNMLVNIITPASSYPEFYLTISNDTLVNKYECQKVEDFPTNVYCTGPEMYPGEALQFTLIAVQDDTVLAEGKFAIIGLLLPNPNPETTETPALTGTAGGTGTVQPNATSTAIFLQTLTPSPTLRPGITSTPTQSTPSYPNPTSYP